MSKSPLSEARTLFERQIDCIRRDDRAAQMALYADDLLYEFPFATDRPRRIEGKTAFLAVMQPIWEQGRGKNVMVTDFAATLHETVTPGSIVAEFTFTIEIGGKTAVVPFVQFISTRDGRITTVREYFNPALRAELVREQREQ